MLTNLKTYYIMIAVFLMNTFISLSLSNAQENYLLLKTDIPGYELARQSKIHWAINSEDKILMGIGQKWTGKIDKKNIYIEYCKFNDEAEAFTGTAYAAVKSNATPFIWGSFNGSIIADGSWIAINGGAGYFVRGNVGVKLFKPGKFNGKDRQYLSSISSKLSAKIYSHLTPDIIANEEKAKQKQIPLTKYNAITGGLKVLDKFSYAPASDSKWIIDSDRIVLGKRKEWKNIEGLKVVIDICQFNTEQDAASAGEVRSRNTYLYDRFIDLEELDSLNSLLDQWKEKCREGLPDHSFSVVGIKGNKAIHVYLFKESGIDNNYFRLLFEELNRKL